MLILLGRLPEEGAIRTRGELAHHAVEISQESFHVLVLLARQQDVGPNRLIHFESSYYYHLGKHIGKYLLYTYAAL